MATLFLRFFERVTADPGDKPKLFENLKRKRKEKREGKKSSFVIFHKKAQLSKRM